MWSVYCYNILNMTRMLVLGSMRRFGFELMYGGQKMGILTVSWPNNNYYLGFTSNEYWIVTLL